MTIFQKMIFVPIISLIFYGSFITYSFFEHRSASQKVKQIRDDYIPILTLVNENIYLLEHLKHSFQDAVLANNVEWLQKTSSIRQEIEVNFSALSAYPNIFYRDDLKRTQEHFLQYYNTNQHFSEKMILENGDWKADESVLINIEYSFTSTVSNLEQLKHKVKLRFTTSIDETSDLLSQLLFWGSIISIVSIIFIVITTLITSASTRRSINIIVERTKELALGSTDFSRRVNHHNDDEIGCLVHWFNKLSDKLEEDYIRLKEVSITDKLTQLNNRTRTDQFLPEMLSKVTLDDMSLVLVILDLDHFKRINDNYGHLAGDKVLQTIADTLKIHATNNDYISRWGGEEFLLLWSNINATEAYQKAEKLKGIIQHIEFDSIDNITASFGLAVAMPGDTNESIIYRADKKLYEAKENGRNCIYIDDSLD